MDLHGITQISRPRERADLPAWNTGDAWLAGGTWLFSEPQLQVNRLIDIADLGWLALEQSERGLRVAATCKIAELDGQFGLGDDEVGSDWHNVKQQNVKPDLGSITGDLGGTAPAAAGKWDDK